MIKYEGHSKSNALKALLVQDFTNLVYIWHKHDRTHLFAISNRDIFLRYHLFATSTGSSTTLVYMPSFTVALERGGDYVEK